MWFPGQPRSAATRTRPAAPPLGGARAGSCGPEGIHEKFSVRSHLAARGACHQCHCTAPRHAEVPSLGNRDRGLESRPAGPPPLLPPRPHSSLRFWFRCFSVPQPPVAQAVRLREQLGAWGMAGVRKGTKDRQLLIIKPPK